MRQDGKLLITPSPRHTEAGIYDPRFTFNRLSGHWQGYALAAFRAAMTVFWDGFADAFAKSESWAGGNGSGIAAVAVCACSCSCFGTGWDQGGGRRAHCVISVRGLRWCVCRRRTHVGLKSGGYMRLLSTWQWIVMRPTYCSLRAGSVKWCLDHHLFARHIETLAAGYAKWRIVRLSRL